MKKRILSFLLALLMVLTVVSPQTFAADAGKDYSGNIGKYVQLNESVTAFAVCYADTVDGTYMTNVHDDFKDGSIFEIVDWTLDSDNALWYRVKFYSGGVIDSSYTTGFPEQPWIKQVDDALVFLDICDACGKPDCSGHDEEEETAPSISGTLTDSQGNEQTVTVYAGEEFPEGADLSVETVGVSAQLTEFKLSESRLVFGYDIQVLQDGAQWQPAESTEVMVKLPVEAAAGTKIGILHTHGDNTTFIGLTEVLDDGTIEFWTDGFSEFVGFTVDFHYGGVDYSIAGMSSIRLSELFEVMKIEEDASQVTSVVFSDPDLVEVTKLEEEGDWLLTSLDAFDTNETLIVTFSDGEVIVIDVTDARRYFDFGSLGIEGHTKDTYGTGSKSVTVILYNQNTNNELGRSTVSNVERNFYLTLNGSNSDYWFELRSISGGSYLDDDPYGSEDEYHLIFAKNWGNTSNMVISMNCWPRWEADSDYCTDLEVVSKTAATGHTETRTIQIQVYRNGSYVTEETFTALFPDRNGDDNGHGDINFGRDLSAPKAKAGYELVSTGTSGSTYVVKVKLITYTISYTLNGGTNHADNPSSYNIESSKITLKDPTREGYVFMGWEEGNTINAGSTGNKTFTAQWKQLYTVTLTKGNGISAVEGAGTYHTGDSVTIDATVENHHTWVNWTDADGKQVSADKRYTFTMPASNVTYTANARPNNYTYTIVCQTTEGGTELHSATVANPYGTVANIPAPEIPGYTAKVTSQQVTWDAETKTITFVYTPDSYTIRFNGSGITNPDDFGNKDYWEKTVGYDEEVTLNNVGFIKDGYRLVKWRLEGATDADDRLYNVGDTVSKLTTGGTAYITAIWEPITYTVTFDPGNGSGTMSSVSAVFGQSLTLPQNTFTAPTGTAATITYNNDGVETTVALPYTFAGWEDQGTIDHNNVAYAYSVFDAPYYADKNGDVFKAYGYNKYDLLKHYIAYVQYGTEDRPYIPDQDKKELPGIYPDGATVSNLATTANNSPVNLVAQWKPESVILSNPSKTGYTFDGWFDPDGNRVGGGGDTYQPTGNITLTAKWTKIYANLTVTLTDPGAGKNYVFIVTNKAGNEVNRVVLHSGNQYSVTICDLPVDEYTVTPLSGWVWRQSLTTNNATVSLENGNTEVKFSCSFIAKLVYWLNGYGYNKKGGN